MDNNASIVIDLASRYAGAFGIVKASEMMSAVSITKEDDKYHLDFFDDFNPEDEKVYLIHDHIVVSFGDMLHGDASAIFAPPMMLNFQREKDLVETQTNGEDNVIVERWGTKPWSISMRGILVDMEFKKYPSTQISKLHKLFKINDKLEVVGKQFEEKDIAYIYLKDVSISPLEGFSDTVQFDFTASSIKENSWTLNQPNP